MLLHYMGLARRVIRRFFGEHPLQNPVDGDGRPGLISAPAPPQNRPPVDAEGVTDLLVREARRPEFIDQPGRLRFDDTPINDGRQRLLGSFCLGCNHVEN